MCESQKHYYATHKTAGSDFIEALGGVDCIARQAYKSPSWRPASAENGYEAKLLENPANILLPGQNGICIRRIYEVSWL